MRVLIIHMTCSRLACLAVVLVLGLSVLGPGCAYLAPRSQSYGPAAKDGAVLFRFYAPTARRVQLAGNWPGNNWGKGDGSAGEANIGLMEDKDGDGVWQISVVLPPGRYKYLYWVDENTWHLDPGKPEEVGGGPAGVCSQLVLFKNSNGIEIR
ncbi:MAG: glycogen-binding domain-containing protein [Candidatus Latescibacterota bacterium]|nr:MAG: glycogen-binding domain-containing protein [Candidatus Latescibacterota bacterium]